MLLVNLLIICYVIGNTLSQKTSTLFPYGLRAGDEKLQTDVDEASSFEFHLKVPIAYYEKTYSGIYINSNGFLSFLTEIPNFYNIQFPLDYPVIAAFYSDVDTRASGAVYYRETDASDLLSEMTASVRKHFSAGINFQATSLFIATWDRVGYFNSKSDKVNTYQIVIGSDGQQSFLLFIYSDIQWIHGEGKNPNFPDARAQVGFMSGEGQVHLLVNSGKDQIRNIYRITNVGERGLWMFRIGITAPNGNVQEPDMNLGEAAISISSPQNCNVGAAFCHEHATCIDHSPGFCCVCTAGFYGNGKNCLQDEIPQRLNGKVTGVVNDEHLDDSDLHAYIVTAEGRAFTAISRVKSVIGYDIQVLLPLGEIVGWLFAVPQGKARNGYSTTDGVFNHTAEIKFPQTGQQVKIHQNFLGLDVFNHLRMVTEIRGSLPSIPFENRIEFDDYEEEYTRVSPGLIRSHGKRTYHLENGHITYPFTVDQTITYEECPYGPVDPELNTLRLKVTRSYIVYDPREEVIRYSVINKITPLITEDPCKKGSQSCGQHSTCVVDGDSFRCICDRGYEHLYTEGAYEESAICIDINECSSGKDNCHNQAECINQPGSFSCRCLPGFTGDGLSCNKDVQTCANLKCSEDADCIQVQGNRFECRCKPGFKGNGLICFQATYPEAHKCAEDDICDANADCIFDDELDDYVCKCLEGYTGNGIICVEEFESCDIDDNCHTHAECIYDQSLGISHCICKPGYYGNGYNCASEAPLDTSCNVINDCHPDAQCVFDINDRLYTCRCNAGFEGDGYYCVSSGGSCDTVNICSIYASCVYNSHQNKHICQCIDNYAGDGINCSPIDECKTDKDCDRNAQCLLENISQRLSCRCAYGYVGNGKQCSLGSGASCDIADNCDPNAKCMYDSLNLQYHCLCNSGYTGDGFMCQKSVVSCNIHNNCHPSAECEYDTHEQGYRCQCHQGFIGDGLNCAPSHSCASDPNLCHENAECVRHPILEHYVCQCQEGYRGDGYTCNAIPVHDGNFLLVNQGMATVRLPIKMNPKEKGKPVVLIPHQTAVGIDVDCTLGTFYWADIAGGAIKQAQYDGTNPKTFIDENMISPECLVVDWVSRNIYWTDSGKDTVEVAKLETQERKVLFSENLSNPRGIAAHPGKGKIYWSDWERTSPKIEVGSMDGTSREVFVGDNLGLPNSLTIDYEREDLCWADAGTQRIECINLNGGNRRTVIAPVAYPFGLTNNRDTVFWTDWDTKSIQSASKAGYNLDKPIVSPLGGNSKLYGIVAVPERCPRVSNPCALNNGGCSYLCLPNGHGGRTCMCPDRGDNEEVDACNEIS